MKNKFGLTSWLFHSFLTMVLLLVLVPSGSGSDKTTFAAIHSPHTFDLAANA